MGSKYHHLTESDRIFLRVMLEKHYSKAKIAKILGVHRSTIYREISRNSHRHWLTKQTSYESYWAQKQYLKRRQRDSKLVKNKALQDYVHDKLLKGWSPWQIEGRLKRERDGNNLISHETIYRYIYSDYGIRNRFYKKLRRKHFLRIKRYTRKPRFPKDLLINNRPESINNRDDFGHWECDLMLFKRSFKGNLITLRERKTRFMIAIKNANKTAKGTALGIITMLKRISRFIKSITFDQGSEFQSYSWVSDCLKADIYFCEPASPHQKGGIENGNGVIRAELPRSCNIDILAQKDITKLLREINKRPMGCLFYQTPEELFFKETGFLL